MNYWDEIRNALDAAKEADTAVKMHARQMGGLLVGKCRHLSCSDAEALKRELQDYNIHTRNWKKK